jgi:PAS domain S-box-containing protein
VADLARPVRRGLRGVHRRGEAEIFYRAILDTTVDAIAVIDQHEIVRTFNRAAERLFGYAADAVIGQPVGMLLPDPINTTENLYLDPHRRGPAAIWRRAHGRRADGSTIPLALSAAGWIEGTRPYLTVTVRVAG